MLAISFAGVAKPTGLLATAVIELSERHGHLNAQVQTWIDGIG